MAVELLTTTTMLIWLLKRIIDLKLSCMPDPDMCTVQNKMSLHRGVITN